MAALILRECRRLTSRLVGTGRRLVLNAVAITFVTFCLPWFIGLGFLSAFVVIPLACLSVFLVADFVADSFADSGGARDVRVFASRIGACVLVGWIAGLTILCGGLLAMNAIHWGDELLLPPALILVDAALLSFAVSILGAGVALTAVRKFPSLQSVKLALKLTIALTVLLLLHGCNRLQADGRLILTDPVITKLTWMASVFCVVNGLALLALGAGSNDRPRPRPKTQAGSG